MNDVIVVGGGFVGSAVTWQLGRAGQRVAWVNDDIAGSASAAGGAMLAVHSEVSAHQDAESIAADVGARQQSRDLWDAWLPELNEAGDVLVTPGIYVVATNAQDAASIAAMRVSAAASGAKALSVNGADIPGLRPDRGLEPAEAIHLPGESSVDGALLLAAMHAACRRMPNVTVNSERAARVDATPAGVVLHTSSGALVRGREVVLACGVETAALLAASGLNDAIPPLFGGRGISLVVRSPDPAPACIRTPNRAFACGLHIVPRAGDLTYLGATNRLTTQPELSATARLDELDDVIRGCVRELDRGLRRAELISSAVGHRPVTLDRLPLVGRTEAPSILVATGTWRNGAVLAPLVADLIAAEIAEPGSTSTSAFAPTRSMVPAALDGPAIDRAAEGIVSSLLGDASLAPGRAAELTEFLRAAISREIDADGPTNRTVARLLERAPMEEALPLVFDLLARRLR